MSRYTIGQTEVNAWKITNARYDSDTQTFYVTLEDEREIVRPATHGYRPKEGDYIVQGPPVVTRLGTGFYSTPAVPSVVSARDFVNTYTPVASVHEPAPTEPEPAPTKPQIACETAICLVSPSVTGTTKKRALENWNYRAEDDPSRR